MILEIIDTGQAGMAPGPRRCCAWIRGDYF